MWTNPPKTRTRSRPGRNTAEKAYLPVPKLTIGVDRDGSGVDNLPSLLGDWKALAEEKMNMNMKMKSDTKTSREECLGIEPRQIAVSPIYSFPTNKLNK